MFNRKYVLTVLAGGIASMSLTGTALAGPYNEPAFQDELQACAAAVRERVDSQGATRIVHTLTSVEPRGAGYILQFDTSVYKASADVPAQTLTTRCRAQGTERLIALDVADTTKALLAKN